MDEETKGKLLAILDEPFYESSGTSKEYNDDEDINLDYDSDSSQSGKGCTCTEAFCTCGNKPKLEFFQIILRNISLMLSNTSTIMRLEIVSF